MNKSVKYPFSIEKNKQLKTISDVYDTFDQRIKIFFLTPIRSRIARPELGTSIYQYIGEPVTSELNVVIKQTIEDEFKRNFRELTLMESIYDAETKTIIFKYNLRIDKNPIEKRQVNIRLFE